MSTFKKFLLGFGIFIVIGAIGSTFGGDDKKPEETVEESSEDTKENNSLDLNDEMSEFLSGDYLYITGEDLEKYSPNMENVKVYVVVSISDIKENKIQASLTDNGVMMSSFNINDNFEKYKSSLKKDDTVAIMGTVSGYNDYKVMGKSIEVNDCKVFAIGNDANTYIKNYSDEGLSEYFSVTEEVAKSNSDISEEEYKNLCESLDYEDILRNPDNNNGKYCLLSGKVDQIIEGWLGSYTIFISDSSGNKWGCVYSYEEGESHLLEGDKVTIYGECKGTETTKTVLGKQVTLPKIDVKYIE